jgi:hypothetical protein
LVLQRSWRCSPSRGKKNDGEEYDSRDLEALEVGEHNLTVFSASDVPFLKERGTLDAARASKSKDALVLAFFFNHVVPNSGADLAVRDIPCSMQLR